MCLVAALLQLYLLAIFGRIILSWIPLSPDSAFAGVARFLYSITEPVLGPLRRAIPSLGFIDITPLIVVIVIQLLLSRLNCGSLF